MRKIGKSTTGGIYLMGKNVRLNFKKFSNALKKDVKNVNINKTIKSATRVFAKVFTNSPAAQRTGFNPLVLLILAIITAFSVTSIRTSYINNKLNKQIEFYAGITTQQVQMLDAIKVNSDKTDQKIIEFDTKYREIADTYVMGRINNDIVTRGSNVDRSFANEMTELKGILEELSKIDALSDTTIEQFNNAESQIRSYMDALPDIWPAYGRITSYYGNRNYPYDYTYIEHTGLDIGASYGAPIQAAASGYVILSSYYGGYGNCIIINHGNGLATLYAHCSDLYKYVGEYVSKGEVIAAVGNTGNSEGSHLHFEIRVNGSPVDPLNYLP